MSGKADRTLHLKPTPSIMVASETILKWTSLPPGSVTGIRILTILRKMILQPKPGWHPATLVPMLSFVLGSEILILAGK